MITLSKNTDVSKDLAIVLESSDFPVKFHYYGICKTDFRGDGSI